MLDSLDNRDCGTTTATPGVVSNPLATFVHQVLSAEMQCRETVSRNGSLARDEPQPPLPRRDINTTPVTFTSTAEM